MWLSFYEWVIFNESYACMRNNKLKITGLFLKTEFYTFIYIVRYVSFGFLDDSAIMSYIMLKSK